MPRPNPPRLLGGERGLALRVAFERERRGWTSEGLARRMTEAGCPINQSAVWKIENGDPPRRITYDEALGFAEVFGIPLVELARPPAEIFSELVASLATEYQEAWAAHQAALLRLRTAADTARAAAEKIPDLVPYIDEVTAQAGDEVPADLWHLRAALHPATRSR